jgi:hypothetical protein
MVNIQEIQEKELLDRIIDHEKKGGALRICVFKISENYLGELSDEYLAHLVTARQTLEKQNYEWNFHFNKVAGKGQYRNFKFATIDYEKLDSSGHKIDLIHFLGPHFDIEKYKPIVRGQLGNETLNSYFYYDTEESPVNKVDMNKLDADFRKLYRENKGCFIYTLMEPPYNMRLGKEILKRGEYVLDFLEYFFGDLSKLIIYSWNTDCSVVFDAGKEWWGSYFWTVYNPTKQWYIGIIASETD